MRFLILTASLLLAGFNAHASVVLQGSDVEFSFADAFDRLFGTPYIEGNSLKLSPSTFSVGSKSGVDFANATTPLVIITAKSGYVLTGVSLFEQGDYFRIEGTPNTTFVSAVGQFIVNDNQINTSTDQNLSAAFSFNVLANGATFSTTPWTISENVALTAANSVTVKLQNILVAGVGSEFSAAFIEKKLITIGATVTAVPVPGAMWLFVTGVLSLVTIRRKAISA